MYSAYKLNKQGDNIQPWCTPFPIWSQSVVPCPVLTVASWPAYRFLRRQVRWSGITISWRIFHSLLWSYTVKDSGIISKEEVDVLLEFSCFFYDPMDADNLTFGSSFYPPPVCLFVCLFWLPLFSLAPKTTADGDCSHEIKRCLLLGRKAMTNLDSVLKSRDITLSTKVHLIM